MKKRIAMIALIAVMLGGLIPATKSQAEQAVQVEVNGQTVAFPDAQPFVDKQNRVQVPLRLISEMLGAQITWSPEKKQVSISQNAKTITLTLGNKVIYVNGAAEEMDTSAVSKGSRTYVPLRFITQALGAEMTWDTASGAVAITTGEGGSVPTPVKQPAKQPEKKPAVPKKQTINASGFIIPKEVEQESKLLIYDESEYRDKNGVLINILLTFGEVGENHTKQLQEVDQILRQKINGKTVDAAMKYVKKKTKISDILPMKSFKDSKYEVVVMSDEYSDVNVKIYYK